MKYTDELLEEAKMFAIRAHGTQDYDGFPYHKHLKDVVKVLKDFGYGNKYQICGWLHDAIEDTATSHADLKKHFGIWVAETVYDVTDELGRNRLERKEKTLPKTAKNNDAIILKLADRICNLSNSQRVKHKMFNQYLEEYQILSLTF